MAPTCLWCALVITLHHYILISAHRDDISIEEEWLGIRETSHLADCAPVLTPMFNTRGAEALQILMNP